MGRRSVIRLYRTFEWAEIAVLAALALALLTIVESGYLQASPWTALLVCSPFVGAGLAWRHYEFEPAVNRTSAALVASIAVMGVQAFLAIAVT